MDYAKFRLAMKEAVSERFGDKAEVYLQTVTRMNSTSREALVIEEFGKDMSPRIYLEEFYEYYMETGEFERCVDAILRICEEPSAVCIEYIPRNWEMAKPQVRMKMANKMWNQKKLEEVPYIEYLDLAVLFYVFIQEVDGMVAMLPITREIMRRWKIGVKELWEAAKENLQKEVFEINPIEDLLKDFITDIEGMENADGQIGTDRTSGEMAEKKMLNGEERCGLYVLTSMNRSHAARGILRKDIMKEFASQQGGNLFLIPSSIHEILLLKDNGQYDINELKQMVRDVNDNPDLIDSEERLSNKIYYYNRKAEKIEIVK